MGPNTELGGSNCTPCHLDLPLLGCTLTLDGELIVENGVVVHPAMQITRDGVRRSHGHPASITNHFEEKPMSAQSAHVEPVTESEELDVLLVGAGFSGLYLLDRLRDRGFKVRLFEAGAGLGGIWHWNCYPGARVDTECWVYQFSREELWKDWNWTEVFPGYAEMRAYFEHVDAKLDLSRDIRFETWVRGADFDEERRQWRVQAEGKGGEEVSVQTRYFVLCTGFGSKPYFPEIEGLDSFAGECHHTALWPQAGIDLKGKRVGVVGTGASGVQIAQEASCEAGQLTVFQRTPNLCLPMRQRKLDEADNRVLRESYPERFSKCLGTFGGVDYDINPRLLLETPEEERTAHFETLWKNGGLKFWVGNYMDILQEEAANRVTYDFWRDKVRARIKDPVLAEKLAPTDPPHPFGTKRVSLEQWYFDMFNQDNVELVDIKETPIERVTPNGVVVNGREVELDVLALATGFDAVTGGLTRLEIRDSQGVTLREKWADGVRTYQGLANAGYPNLLVSYGPQAPTGFLSGPTSAEVQGDFIVETLEYLREHGYTRIEPTHEAEEAWRKLCQELAAPTLFIKADSWYMGTNVPGKAKEMLMYTGGLPAYLEELRDCVAKGYEGYELA
jgi:cation diffusion facilitator CzcD-associated flavoprotein CzcO